MTNNTMNKQTSSFCKAKQQVLQQP